MLGKCLRIIKKSAYRLALSLYTIRAADSAFLVPGDLFVLFFAVCVFFQAAAVDGGEHVA